MKINEFVKQPETSSTLFGIKRFLSQGSGIIALTLSLLLISGCANQSVSKTPTSSLPVEEVEVVEAPLAPLDGKTVYTVLAAEMALANEDYELALGFYLSLLKSSNDAEVAKRVVAISQTISAFPEMLEAALIWQKSEPDNPIAYLSQTRSLLKMERIEEMAEPIAKIIALSPEFPLETIFSNIENQTKENLVALEQLFKGLLANHPNNSGLYLAQANALLKTAQWQQAKIAAENSLAIKPSVNGYTALARAIEQVSGIEDAANTIKKALKAFPLDRQLTAQFARLISKLEQPEKALSVMDDYYRAHPDDQPMVSMYARIALETGEMDTARRLYENLLESPSTINEASYFLGTIAYESDRLHTAVEYFQQVRPSNYFAAAIGNLVEIIANDSGQQAAITELDSIILAYPTQSEGYRQLARLYYNNEQYESAVEVLNDGLNHIANNQNLLYSRALALDIIGQHEDAIADLRQVLSFDPQNVMALNALGYTLADNSINLDEAFELIRQAYALDSEDPAIIDSLGWIHYRRGDLEQAENYLKQAFDKTKNHEIAAHLGEVLWFLDRQSEAEAVWNEGLEDDPDSKYIMETQKRLKSN